MMNDIVRLVCERAVERFGGRGGMFNSANFSHCLSQVSGARGSIDGRIVRSVLCGRSDIEVLSGGSHYRIKCL